MICPKCKIIYVCPCESCDPKKQNKLWSFIKDDIQCNTCGLIENASWWLYEEVRQLCEATGSKTLTEALEKLKN